MESTASRVTSQGRARILMLAPSPDISGPIPGPIGKLAKHLALALDDVGYTVDTELWGRHRREEGPAMKVAGRAADLLRVRRRMRATPYGLVFIHTTHDWRALTRELLLVLPSRRRVKWVFLVHGTRFEPDRRLLERATGWLVRRSSAVLLLSTEEIDQWQQLFPEGRFYHVANVFMPLEGGAQEAIEEASARGGPEFLFVGRLIREKGVFDLLDAFAVVRASHQCHLTIAGEGPESEEMKRRADELDIRADVEFTGHLSEDRLRHAYQKASALVLPTYWGEGLPTVLLEAMSFGLPIVTTRIRGAADYLSEPDNALFVPPMRPDALAQALTRILDEDTLCVRMRENNLGRVRQFAPAQVVMAYERAFEDVLGRG